MMGFLISCTLPLLILAPSTHSQGRDATGALAHDTLVDVGGHRLRFTIWDGTGATSVVLESGGGADAASWASVPGLLSDRTGARIIAYDRAGLGQSDLGPLALTPDEEIRHLHVALEHLGISGALLLVGHSYGGVLAVVEAARYPQRIAGLVLVDPMNSFFVEAMGIDWLQQTVPGFPDPKSNREHVANRMKRTFPGLAREAGQVLMSVATPMIVLTAGQPWWGSEAADAAWRRSHETMSEAPGRVLVVAEESAHDIPGTQPQLIVDAVARLLSR